MGIISKISDKLHHDKDADPTTASNTSTSAHNTVSSPNDTKATTASGTGSHGLSTNNYGATPSSSGYGSHSTTTGSNVPSSNTTTTAGMANKARLDADHNNSEFISGAGPHSSSTANRVDPRVDDSTTGYGRHNEYNSGSGPHSSSMANKADPRIDSDRSHLGGVGGSHGQFADTVSPSSHGAGYGSSSAAPLGAASGTAGHTNFSGREPYPNTTSNTHAPLNSSAPGPYGIREDYGSTGPASHTLGPHSSNAANVVDPRVQPEPEKMKDHKTVGPHHSDMLNKLDPRVDSDPRHHGYTDRDPTHPTTHSTTHSHNDNSRFDSNALDHSGRQTGGFVGGPHERLENRGSIPTAGGLPVGEHGNGPYSGTSHSTGLTGSHGGVTGSHGGLTGNSHSNEPYGSSHAYGSSTTTSGPHASDMANKADPRVDSDNSRFASTGHGHPTTGSGITGSHTAGSGIPGTSSHNTSSGIPGSASHHTSSGLPGSTSHHTSSGLPGSTTHHTSSGIPGTSSHNTTGSSDLEFRERELGLRQRELDLKEREMEHGMRRL